MNKELQIIKKTRKFASDTLLKTLEDVLRSGEQISELGFKKKWLENLRANAQIFPEGWYMPPPDGITVLFGDEDNPDRINFDSLRQEKYWPKDNSLLNAGNGLATFYTSCVDKNSGLIGDFGLTVYFGKNPKIIEHFINTHNLIKDIYYFIRVGMELREVTNYAHNSMHKKGMFSELLSPSDPTGTNIGHTIPYSYEDPLDEELSIIQNGRNDWKAFCKLISVKRKFLNRAEQFNIKAGMAFTIEPRPLSQKDPTLPMVLFHSVVLIHDDGSKELLQEFDSIFELTGMDYLLK